MTPAGESKGENRPLADQRFAAVYDSLKALAHTVRAGRAGETLNTTALVHEAFLKLAGASPATWDNDAHFFALAARAMRHILVDAARKESAAKRGGAEPRPITFDEAVHVPATRASELIALDEALVRLAQIDPRRARVVEHRIFAGLSTAEIAKLLRTATAAVERDWRDARAWL